MRNISARKIPSIRTRGRSGWTGSISSTSTTKPRIYLWWWDGDTKHAVGSVADIYKVEGTYSTNNNKKDQPLGILTRVIDTLKMQERRADRKKSSVGLIAASARRGVAVRWCECSAYHCVPEAAKVESQQHDNQQNIEVVEAASRREVEEGEEEEEEDSSAAVDFFMPTPSP